MPHESPLLLIETLRFEPGTGFIRLTRHLARMDASAAAFGMMFRREAAMAALEQESAHAHQVLRVRLTLDAEENLDCSSAPLLPETVPWRVLVSSTRVRSGDAFLQHKTDRRRLFDDEYRKAQDAGCDEVLFLNERGELTQGSRTNLFLQMHGELLTPPASAGLLPGCLRQEMLESGACREAALFESDLARAETLYVGNSLRGLLPAILDMEALGR